MQSTLSMGLERNVLQFYTESHRMSNLVWDHHWSGHESMSALSPVTVGHAPGCARCWVLITLGQSPCSCSASSPDPVLFRQRGSSRRILTEQGYGSLSPGRHWRFDQYLLSSSFFFLGNMGQSPRRWMRATESPPCTLVAHPERMAARINALLSPFSFFPGFTLVTWWQLANQCCLGAHSN